MFARFKDVALLLGRIGVGVVFLAHGLQKWEKGIDGTAKFFEQTGIPLPTLAAIFAIAVEIVGGILFIVGFLTPLVGLGFVVVSVGALLSVHLDNGLTGQGGYEFVLVLAVTGLALGFNAGKLSLDHVLFGRKREVKQLQDA
ncbi:DoxX family protein [Amycolatopsis sp. QT-25]|uniref:DoxX family protein n=1 Tax=Amycolatopsis sp. QT-25 TaxID=3034022 RepID=UPI0023ECF3DA|nr:DoxX family protein [Amycolatopsis sp. QT-25]WET80544.1 DoxX family protein [Amycolatopsis sp. QT-25]